MSDAQFYVLNPGTRSGPATETEARALGGSGHPVEVPPPETDGAIDDYEYSEPMDGRSGLVLLGGVAAFGFTAALTVATLVDRGPNSDSESISLAGTEASTIEPWQDCDVVTDPNTLVVEIEPGDTWFGLQMEHSSGLGRKTFEAATQTLNGLETPASGTIPNGLIGIEVVLPSEDARCLGDGIPS